MTDTDIDTPVDPLSLLAARFQKQPGYMAHALAEHRERLGLTEHEQRLHLGVSVEDWTMLRLCRSPIPGTWAEDLDAIAGRFGVSRERLERAVEGK